MHRRMSPFAAALALAATALLVAPLGGCVVVHVDGEGSWGGGPALAAFAVDTDDLSRVRIAESFPVEPGSRVRFGNVAGSIRIEPGDGPDVEVEATAFADAGDDDATRRLLESVSWRSRVDHGVTVHWLAPDDLPKRIGDPGLRRGRVKTCGVGGELEIVPPADADVTWYAEIVVRMPAGAALSVRNISGPVHAGALHGELSIDTGRGDVEVSALDGELHVDTSSGSVAVGVVLGDVHVDTGSGDVTIESVHGDAHLDTSSGDVSIGEIAGASLVADTSSGDVVVRAGRVTSLRLDTSSGDVIVRGVVFSTLEADTSSGDVRIEGDLSGAERILADTGSGDVEIIGGPRAEFRLLADVGSGDVRVGYHDAHVDRHRGEIVGARRGDGRTVITVDTGSGDCVVRE